MNIARKLLFLCVFVFAIALACITSAFKGATKAQQSGYFYEFLGDQTNPNDIIDATKYERAVPSCVDTNGDLCGIYLQQDAPIGNNPTPADLSTHDNDLNQSVQNGQSADQGTIIMRE